MVIFQIFLTCGVNITIMKPLAHFIQANLYLLLILSFALTCQGCEENGKDLKLRSQENDTHFWDNAKTAAQRLQQIMYRNENGKMGNERFKLVQISDPHLSDYSPSDHYEYPINLIQAVKFANQQELRINALVATGDFISHSDDKERAKSYMCSFSHYFLWENFIPSFACMGNHDSNMNGKDNTASITKEEINKILFSESGNATRQQPNGENYYYADVANPQGGYIRFIALDMLDQPGIRYNTLHDAVFSAAQVKWLIEVALKEGMTDSHSVVILTHYPFQPYSGNASTYLCDGDFIYPWSMIPEIIEAFRGRTVLHKTYANRSVRTENIQVDADFAGYRGEFVCYLGGHAHCDALFSIENLENRDPARLPQRMFLCTNLAPSEKGQVYNTVERIEDTPSSNSFRIYAIDTSEKKIYATHFGAHKSAAGEITEVSY